MGPITKRAWARITGEMAGGLHQYDHWTDVPEDIRQRYVDRELLELAAKAAGIKVERSRMNDPMHGDMCIIDSVRNKGQRLGPWNPLTDDGDALRLLVAMRFTLDLNHHADNDPFVMIGDDTGKVLVTVDFEDESQRDAATRRAIVRSAAALQLQREG